MASFGPFLGVIVVHFRFHFFIEQEPRNIFIIFVLQNTPWLRRYRVFCGGEAVVGSVGWTNESETFLNTLGCLVGQLFCVQSGSDVLRAISGCFYRLTVSIWPPEGELMTFYSRNSINLTSVKGEAGIFWAKTRP